MFQSLQVFDASVAMAKNAGQRQAISAQNLANADTPGYRPLRLTKFSAQFETNGSMGIKSTRGRHIGTNSTQHHSGVKQAAQTADPNGNGVSLENELMRAAEAKSDHTRALSIFQSSLKILRLSLGKS